MVDQGLRLASIDVRSGFILNEVRSTYALTDFLGNQVLVPGPLHGGFPGGDDGTIDLRAYWAPRDSGDVITAVSTCCAGSSWGNAAQRILLRTADGREIGPRSTW